MKDPNFRSYALPLYESPPLRITKGHFVQVLRGKPLNQYPPPHPELFSHCHVHISSPKGWFEVVFRSVSHKRAKCAYLSLILCQCQQYCLTFTTPLPVTDTTIWTRDMFTSILVIYIIRWGIIGCVMT